MTSLARQAILVTGATSGIGRAIALDLGQQGATLCLVGRRLEALEEVACKAASSGATVLVQRVDLTRDADIREAAATVRDKLGALDAVVHAAGVISIGELTSAPVDELDQQYRVNVRGAYLLTQE